MEPIRSAEDAEAAVRWIHAQSGSTAQIVEVTCVQVGPNGWHCSYRLDDGWEGEWRGGNAAIVRDE